MSRDQSITGETDINAFHFEVWWELVVVVWQPAPAKDMYLWLNRNRRTIFKSVYIDTIVTGQVWVSTVSKATSRFLGIESGKY